MNVIKRYQYYTKAWGILNINNNIVLNLPNSEREKTIFNQIQTI